jgi:hypothetical protein
MRGPSELDAIFRISCVGQEGGRVLAPGLHPVPLSPRGRVRVYPQAREGSV